MKLGHSAGTFCHIQLQDTIGVPDMLEDNLCSHQTKLEVLSRKKQMVLHNKYR